MSAAFDFRDWAVVAHKDDTGFGRQAADSRTVLGFGWHFVIPSERLANHPVDGISELWLKPSSTDDEVRALLGKVRGILFFERHNWHPRLLRLARNAGVATVCVPNWEWFRGNTPEWRDCNLFACPSRFTEKIVRRFGFTNTVVIPWALDLAKLPIRKVAGPARIFVHNAGIVDSDDRKGTRDTIRAFTRVRRDDIRLIVRLQKPADLPLCDDRIEVRIGNIPDVAQLYATGDVCIQPSKMEGIGFMVLEPAACGMPVVTTDAPPMNEYIRQPELKCAPRWFRRRAYPTQWIPHAHLRLPSQRDLAALITWCAENDMTPYSIDNRSWAEQHFSKASLTAAWTHAAAIALSATSHRP
jgi:glycosyltransferase involved in cell wall biosynthesis